MADRMGDVAAIDSYDPFAAEQFVNPVVDAMGRGLAQTVMAPGQLMQPNPYQEGGAQASDPYASELASWYDDQRDKGAVDWGRDTALGMVGSPGLAGGMEGATLGSGITKAPDLWHGVSTIKLPKPVSEMTSVLRPVNPAPEVVASPARFQNSLLMPLLGDRTATAASLERVNGFQFENPVSLEGGHGYMANNPGMAWAAGKSIAPGIARVAREGAESGLPVHGVYTAMGERSADFSHMVSDTLTEMAKHTKITPEGEALFNETMRKVSPGFPGINDPNVAQYLRDAPGAVRNVFAKTMDTAPMQKYGFPSVAEARVAVTDPRLLNEPTGASGLSIARMDPEGKLGPSGHGTYDTGVVGDYVAGLPASVPKEVMFPDVLSSLSKHADAVAQARVDAGLKPFRPTEDYLMSRMPKGLPKFQEANQQWVDSVSQHLLDRGFTLGSGTADKKGAAAIQGIRAYHSSPHDFDKFDLSKIGTGEGAQAYGHGLYFAENPAVSGQGGQYWQQFKGRALGSDPVPNKAFEYLQSHGFDREAAANSIDKFLQNGINKDNASAVATHTAARDLLRSGAPVGPRTYEVNINADPAHMLDWDKPFASPDALEAFASKFDTVNPTTRRFLEDYSYANQKAGRPLPDGEDVFRELKALSSPKQFSQEFSEAGIPGIKYLDQGSRGANAANVFQVQKGARFPFNETDVGKWAVPGINEPFVTREAALAALPKPSSNYVVFNPGIIDIMKKYGIAGAAAPVGMGALAAQDQYETQ